MWIRRRKETKLCRKSIDVQEKKKTMKQTPNNLRYNNVVLQYYLQNFLEDNFQENNSGDCENSLQDSRVLCMKIFKARNSKRMHKSHGKGSNVQCKA